MNASPGETSGIMDRAFLDQLIADVDQTTSREVLIADDFNAIYEGIMNRVKFIAEKMVPDVRNILEKGENVQAELINYVRELDVDLVDCVADTVERFDAQKSPSLQAIYTFLLDWIIEKGEPGSIAAFVPVVKRIRGAVDDINPDLIDGKNVGELIKKFVAVFESDDPVLKMVDVARFSSIFTAEVTRCSLT